MAKYVLSETYVYVTLFEVSPAELQADARLSDGKYQERVGGGGGCFQDFPFGSHLL